MTLLNTLSETTKSKEVNIALSSILRMGDIQMLLSHSDIHSVEHIIDVEIDGRKKGVVGYIAIKNNKWPVYCLDENLSLDVNMPVEWNICVMLRHAETLFGVLCESLKPMRLSENQFQPMPECMMSAEALMDAIVIIDINKSASEVEQENRQLAFQTSADKLYKFIEDKVC
jgi:hypothetical protein